MRPLLGPTSAAPPLDTADNYTQVQWSDALVSSVSSCAVLEMINTTFALTATTSATFRKLGPKKCLDSSNWSDVGVCVRL